MDIGQTAHLNRYRHARRGNPGFTLIEVLVSLAVLVLTSVGGVSGFVLLNRYASDNRDRSAAKALCQERIEQIMTLPYRPAQGNGFMPVVTSQDSSTTYYLLGQVSTATTDYTNTGYPNFYTGTASQQTSTTSGEPVIISVQPNGAATATTPVKGFRFTTVTNVGTPTAPLVQASVTVTWTIRGNTNSYVLYTLRSPD